MMQKLIFAGIISIAFGAPSGRKSRMFSKGLLLSGLVPLDGLITSTTTKTTSELAPGSAAAGSESVMNQVQAEDRFESRALQRGDGGALSYFDVFNNKDSFGGDFDITVNVDSVEGCAEMCLGQAGEGCLRFTWTDASTSFPNRCHLKTGVAPSLTNLEGGFTGIVKRTCVNSGGAANRNCEPATCSSDGFKRYFGWSTNVANSEFAADAEDCNNFRDSSGGRYYSFYSSRVGNDGRMCVGSTSAFDESMLVQEGGSTTVVRCQPLAPACEPRFSGSSRTFKAYPGWDVERAFVRDIDGTVTITPGAFAQIVSFGRDANGCLQQFLNNEFPGYYFTFSPQQCLVYVPRPEPFSLDTLLIKEGTTTFVPCDV